MSFAARLMPAGIAAAFAAAVVALKVPGPEAAAATLVLAAAIAALAWALADLEQFVLVGVLGAMIFPQALVSPAGTLVAAADLLLVVALGAWLLLAAVDRAPRLAVSRNPILLPALLFAGVNAASFAWSVDPGATLETAVQIGEIVVVIPLVFASVPTSLARLRSSLAVYVVLTCALALVAFALFAPRAAGGDFSPQYLPGLHKNAIGSFLGVGLVLAYTLWLESRRRAFAFATVVLFAGLCATISRGAIAGSLAGILVVSFLLRRSRLRTLAIVAGAAALFLVAVQLRAIESTSQIGGFSSSEVRRYSFDRAVDKIREAPVLGSGAGTYWDEIPELNIGLADPNNLFLLTWAELGLVGLGALFVLLGAYALAFVRARRIPVAVAAGGAAFSQLVHFQVDSTWTRGTASICFAMVGVLVAATRLARPAPAAVAEEPVRAVEGRLRVLHLISSDGYAGIERHVVRLARDLRERGCDATIACPPWAARTRAAAAAAGVPVVPAAGPRRAGWLNDLRAETDIVHVHDGIAAVAAWPLAAAAGARVVRTQHFVQTASSARRGWRRAASLAMHRTLNADVAAIVAVSDSVAQAMAERREANASKVVVIPPGIDVPAEVEPRATEPVVAFVGRLEREKGLPLLLEAARLVRNRVPDARFVIAGSGSAEDELRAQARSLRLGRAVEWRGEVAEPAEVFADARLYVNPAPAEGFGLAVAEAMAHGLPVVGIRGGGVAEIVVDGETGLLVEDDANALADAVVSLLTDPERASRLGANGRARAWELYDAARTAELTLELYEALR